MSVIPQFKKKDFLLKKDVQLEYKSIYTFSAQSSELKKYTNWNTVYVYMKDYYITQFKQSYFQTVLKTV